MANNWTSVGTTSNFETTVIEPSHECAVLVDFWAEWCAPCRALAPVIDALAEKLGGALKVVKVDSDAEPALAQTYAIRSLPTLMVFRNGQPVKQAVGALPAGELEALVRPYLAAAEDPLAEVRAAIAAGQHTAAAAALEEALARNPDDYRLHPLLAECYLADARYADASALLERLPANLALESEVQVVRARLQLADAAALSGDDDLTVAFREAVMAAVRGDFDSAVAALLALLAHHRSWQEDRIRKTLLDVFRIVGDDPRLRQWRTQMARALN